jgi:hypothetical protein
MTRFHPKQPPSFDDSFNNDNSTFLKVKFRRRQKADNNQKATLLCDCLILTLITLTMSHWMTSGASRLKARQTKKRSFSARAQQRSTAVSICSAMNTQIPGVDGSKKEKAAARRRRIAGTSLPLDNKCNRRLYHLVLMGRCDSSATSALCLLFAIFFQMLPSCIGLNPR